MRILGNEILIRDLRYSDAEDFYEYAQSEEVGPRAGWKPIPSLRVAKRVINSYMFSKEVYAIALRENDKLIGTYLNNEVELLFNTKAPEFKYLIDSMQRNYENNIETASRDNVYGGLNYNSSNNN